MIFLSSCGDISAVQLGDRLILEAIGIDFKDGEYLVTVQALNTGAGGSGEGTASEERTNIYNYSAQTPGLALREAGKSSGLLPLFSHARLLVIGKEAAYSRTNELLDFFLREQTVRNDILIAVANGTAAEIIQADITDGASDASAMEKALISGAENGKTVAMPLFRFVDRMLSPTDAAYCPVLSVRESKTSKKREIDMEETAVFDNEGLKILLDAEQTKGLLLLSGKADNMTFSLKGKSGVFVLSTVKSGIKIKPSFTDGKMSFSIRTRLVCDITEYSGGAFTRIGEKELREAEALLTAAAQDMEKRTLDGVFPKSGLDICRFGRKTLFKRPEYYEIYKSKMPELTAYDFIAEVTVRRAGKQALEADKS